MAHQGALGDFLLALPVIEGLHLCYPSLRIDFWVKRAHGDLVVDKAYMGEAHSVDGPDLAPFFHEDLWRGSPIHPSLARCDAALFFGQATSRLAVSRLSERLARPVHWIHSFPDERRTELEPVHVSRYLIEQVRRLTLCVRDTIPGIVPSEAESLKVREWLGRLGRRDEQGRKPVVIHPGSGGRGKIWPLARWWALMHWMRREHDLPLVLTLGPADEYLSEFAKAAHERLGVQPVEGLSLKRLAALLDESRFYLGNDSGVSHLAAAVGVPAAVIFGPTNPLIWAPNGPNVRVIRSHWESGKTLDWSPSAPAALPEPEVVEWVSLQL